MINLQFHNLRDKTPEPNIPINFFVVRNPLILLFGGFESGSNMYKGVCKYDWLGVCSDGQYNGDSCCYDYDCEKENSYYPGGIIIHEDGSTYVKEMSLQYDGYSAKVLPFTNENDHGNDIEITWQYAHIVHYNLAKQCVMSHNQFPVEHLQMLMTDGMITVLDAHVFDVTNRSVDEHKHADVVFDWQGVKWRASVSENGAWPKNAWTDGKYADCFIYRVEKIDEGEK